LSDLAEFIERLDLAPANVAGISDGAVIALGLAMTRTHLVRSLVAVGANYCNDEQVLEANALIDPDALAEHPEFADALAGFHDTHRHPGYWRELVTCLKNQYATEPNFTEADLARISAPTLLIAGELDPWGNLNQMLAMRRAIPNVEMLILNHAGMDELLNHAVQHTRASIVGPVVLDFLGRHRSDSSVASDALLAERR
jgi:pimeloyl-ACP methyl ester carboxylesterase